MESTGLLVSEEFFLLWVTGRTGRDYTGGGRSRRLINGGVAGAMLDDLFLAGRLSFDAAGRVVADPTPTGVATLDVLLATIAEAGQATRHGVLDQQALASPLRGARGGSARRARPDRAHGASGPRRRQGGALCPRRRRG